MQQKLLHGDVFSSVTISTVVWREKVNNRERKREKERGFKSLGVVSVELSLRETVVRGQSSTISSCSGSRVLWVLRI